MKAKERGGGRGGLILIGFLHTVLVLLLVAAPSEFAEKPFRSLDYSAHFYGAHHVSEHLRNTGVYWGYDPLWAAGHPGGHPSLFDNKLFCALFRLAPAGREALVFNSAILLMLLSVPWLLALASRTGGGRWNEAAGCALLASIATFAVPACVIFWTWGGISFFFVSVLVVPIAAALAVALAEESLFTRRGAPAVFGACISVFIHPMAAPLLALLLTPVLWSGNAVGKRVRDVALLGVLLALPLIPILEATLWLEGLFQIPDPGKLAGGLQQLRRDWWSYLLKSSNRLFGAGGLLVILPLAIFGGVAGRAECLRNESRRACVVNRVLLVGAAGFAAATYLVPSLLPRLTFVQPYRFVIVLAFLACVPGGRGLARMLERVTEHRRLTLIAALIAVLIVTNAVRGRLPLLVLGYGVDRAETELLDFLQRATTTNDRVLVESSGTWIPAGESSRRSILVRRFALLPLRIEREFLGYAGTAAFVAHRYVGFDNGVLFGEKLSDIPERRFLELLGRFGISWIVGCTSEALGPLHGFSAVLAVAAPVGECTVFRVRDPQRSRFLEGSGRVRATLDRIEVSGAEGDRIVLKYHWMPKLRTDPPLPIEEAVQPRAPVGFIAVRPSRIGEFVIRPHFLSEAAEALLDP